METTDRKKTSKEVKFIMDKGSAISLGLFVTILFGLVSSLLYITALRTDISILSEQFKIHKEDVSIHHGGLEKIRNDYVTKEAFSLVILRQNEISMEIKEDLNKIKKRLNIE